MEHKQNRKHRLCCFQSSQSYQVVVQETLLPGHKSNCLRLVNLNSYCCFWFSDRVTEHGKMKMTQNFSHLIFLIWRSTLNSRFFDEKFYERVEKLSKGTNSSFWPWHTFHLSEMKLRENCGKKMGQHDHVSFFWERNLKQGTKEKPWNQIGQEELWPNSKDMI